MKIRKSFLIRWLSAVDRHKNERSVIDIEHVQSGEQWRVSSIEEAAEMMKNAGADDFAAQNLSAEQQSAGLIEMA